MECHAMTKILAAAACDDWLVFGNDPAVTVALWLVLVAIWFNEWLTYRLTFMVGCCLKVQQKWGAIKVDSFQ